MAVFPEAPGSRVPTACRIGLVCSHGGHLTEMLELAPAFEGFDTFYYCYDADTTRRLENRYLVANRPYNPIEFLKNLVRSYRILRKEAPIGLVSTGAEIALPPFLVAKVLRIPTIYIECGAQVSTPSMTGRVLCRVVNKFLVQWPELLNAYHGRAEMAGSLIDEGTRTGGAPSRDDESTAEPRDDASYIYVTLGTMYLDFGRLVTAMDAYAVKTGERVIIQTGLNRQLPEHCEHFDFKARDEIFDLQKGARLIVCHGGIGSVIDALQAEKPLIVTPRLKKFGEHNSDHQMELARAVEERGWGRMLVDLDELAEACAEPALPYRGYCPAKEELIESVRGAITRFLS